MTKDEELEYDWFMGATTTCGDPVVYNYPTARRLVKALAQARQEGRLEIAKYVGSLPLDVAIHNQKKAIAAGDGGDPGVIEMLEKVLEDHWAGVDDEG